MKSVARYLIFLPVVLAFARLQAADRIVYPQVAVGPVADQEFTIELRLGNRNPDQPWTGNLHLLRQTDLGAMTDLQVSGSDATRTGDGSWEVAIEADGSLLYRISSRTLQVGALVIEPAESALDDLVASFFYLLHSEAAGAITDLIAVQPSRAPALSYTSMVAQTTPGFNVGLAIVPEDCIQAALGSGGSLPEVDVGVQARLQDGRTFAAVATLGGAEAAQKALFPNQLMRGVPDSFESARLDITASQPVYLTLLGVGSPPLYRDVQIGAAPAQPTSGGPGSLDLSGGWYLTTTQISNTCGPLSEEPATEPMQLIGCGRQLSIVTFDGLWGRGVIHGEEMVLAGSETNPEDFGCPVTLVSSGTGSASQDRIAGHFSSAVSFSPACGDVPDCSIGMEFSMTRIDPATASCFQRAAIPDPADSPYILPFPVGSEYVLNVSYCGVGWGHRNQLAYDFLMPVGDPVTAARGGVVRQIREDSPDDGQGMRHNHVMVQHDDGTVAFYAHLKQFGVMVEAGDSVQAGQAIAYAGHSGTTDVPHLHFGVYQGFPTVEGLDVPVAFKNAAGPVDCRGGIVMGETYRAMPFGEP